MKKQMITVFTFVCFLMTGILSGCEEIPYTVTDREYYKTHTGTEESNTTFPQWEDKTGKKDDMDETSGVITDCMLRTGVETDSYGDALKNDKKVVIPANMTFDILDMDGNFFQVEFDGTKVWLPSNNCLINVKQFIPTLQVDLSLSHSPNYYNIGGNSITGLTDLQLYNNEGSVNGSEVWTRYEVAEKLLKAQEIFLKDGYSIKVIDAYRPNSATIALKDGLNEYLKTSEGRDLRQEYMAGYGPGSFLEQNESPHNYGAAVDITLVDIDSGNELSMPSDIYTLDASSVYETWCVLSDERTSHGEYIRGKMAECGFVISDTKWWHFYVDSIEHTVFDIPN